MSTPLHQKLELHAREHYRSLTPAFVYISDSHHGDKEVRVEAPDIMQAFSRTIPFGRDILGFLYFHGVADFDGNMQYHVAIETRVEDNSVKEKVIVINFWAEEEDATKYDPYAKFIALVPTHAWNKFKPFKKVGGQWNPLDEAQITAHAVCPPHNRHVTISMHPLGKKFDFHIPHGEHHLHTGFDSYGSLVMKDIKELVMGPEFYVDYTNTRIMILEKRHRRPVATFSAHGQGRHHPLFDIAFQTGRGKFSDINSSGSYLPELDEHAE